MISLVKYSTAKSRAGADPGQIARAGAKKQGRSRSSGYAHEAGVPLGTSERCTHSDGGTLGSWIVDPAADPQPGSTVHVHHKTAPNFREVMSEQSFLCQVENQAH